MKNFSSSKSLTTPFSGNLENQVSQEALRLMALSQEHGWNFNILGSAPLPTQSVQVGDWLIIPAHLDSTPIPARTMQRLQAIFSAGIHPRGFVVVHEAPKLLPSPTRKAQGTIKGLVPYPKLQLAFKIAAYTLGALLIGFAAILGVLVMVFAAVILAGVALIPLVLLAGATMVDPILVAVTDDDWWIEIDRWER